MEDVKEFTIDPLFQISQCEKNEAWKAAFLERAKALSTEEQRIFISVMPVDLCMERVQEELNKYDELKRKVNELKI